MAHPTTRAIVLGSWGRGRGGRRQDPVHLWKTPESAVGRGPGDLRLLWAPAGACPSLRVRWGCRYRLPERGLGRQHPRPLGQHLEAVDRGDRAHVEQGQPLVRWPQCPSSVPRPVRAVAWELKGRDPGRGEGEASPRHGHQLAGCPGSWGFIPGPGGREDGIQCRPPGCLALIPSPSLLCLCCLPTSPPASPFLVFSFSGFS